MLLVFGLKSDSLPLKVNSKLISRTFRPWWLKLENTLESMAQVFVKGIKDLKELTKDAKTNEEKIKETVSGMVGASKNAALLGDRYENTVEKITAVIAATGSNTSVSPN